jgi:hypothetical protein
VVLLGTRHAADRMEPKEPEGLAKTTLKVKGLAPLQSKSAN